jgi:TatD DNase family protein
MFIDVHSHLDICENISAKIKNAKKENVKIVTCGINSPSNRKILEIKKENPEVEICLGIYPTDALKLSDKEFNDELKFIKSNKDKILGIGEVGLDLKENAENTLQKQKENLTKFVKLAKEIDKPIIIHSRKAEEECIELLESLGYNKIIMHCFSGKIKLVKKIIENNWKLSIPTSVKNSQHFQQVIELTPMKNLLCETDSPFLHPDKQFPNEPKNVIESYKKIAEIKNISLKEVEKKIEENYRKLFKGN